MIHVTVRQDAKERIVAFTVEGHAGYEESGKDIICSAVSALALTAVNSIEALTEYAFSSAIDEKTGKLDFSLQDEAGHDSQLLLQAFVLGIKGIEESYGSRYIHLDMITDK